MDEYHAFLSVGETATEAQEAFVRAVEERLRSEGVTPHTVGRNTFSADSPLKTVMELMEKCHGTVIIALERTYFPSGVKKRGGKSQMVLTDARYPTPWNQIEAAIGFARGHPLMIIMEKGLQNEGLLERTYEWYIQQVEPTAAALTTPEFNGVLASWKEKVAKHATTTASTAKVPIDQLTIGDILRMKPTQLWV